MRDLRDPRALGELLLATRPMVSNQWRLLSQWYDSFVPKWEDVPDWEGDGFMSSNPANHHSKVKQDIGDLTA